jgi:hypothetical protein
MSLDALVHLSEPIANNRFKLFSRDFIQRRRAILRKLIVFAKSRTHQHHFHLAE